MSFGCLWIFVSLPNVGNYTTSSFNISCTFGYFTSNLICNIFHKAHKCWHSSQKLTKPFNWLTQKGYIYDTVFSLFKMAYLVSMLLRHGCFASDINTFVLKQIACMIRVMFLSYFHDGIYNFEPFLISMCTNLKTEPKIKKINTQLESAFQRIQRSQFAVTLFTV